MRPSSRILRANMRPSSRILQANSGQFPVPAAGEGQEPLAVDSDVVVILAALLCALICVVGLALVARCTWIRRSSSSGGGGAPPPTKGLKKKAIRSLPTVAYGGAVAGGGGAKLAECPICLAEFVEGEEIRILPQCGHGFHVVCIDTWLGSHSSCPSCRRILVVDAPPMCHKCGGDGTASSAAECGAKARENGDANSFLP
ncbi:RING-H2 finger protein ATL8-like [Typha angustifolia]|uniref:RING-H2 finger protein ATL8-like n=1 Tax=Typha angustifolia TaxID=59011 RepID=UPI003C2EE640